MVNIGKGEEYRRGMNVLIADKKIVQKKRKIETKAIRR